uniref:Xylanolytic transcriptional activator regulatory domain-containing protein n=1 Tax=Kwoniella dejecticola CBS 10117 TaxID=1296121 RepID=A0A1A5ZYA0_9TREE|nr:uncharacterized protein I303_07555 [Kwoniella dejecticola CBS 10117]OBR82787.1 hypothetical protein I303_07555 [Kwoniella dejecticola CBS 10117]
MQDIEPVYLGGTSISQLVWFFCPATAKSKLHALDVKYDLYRGALCDSDEQGLLVGRESKALKRERLGATSLNTALAKLAESVGAETVLQNLYDTASERIIPIFPVISKHESLINDQPDEKYWERFVEMHHNSAPPTPLPGIVRIIHCALAAMSREVPSDIRQNILSTLQNLLVGPELDRIRRTSTIASVQVLVSLTICDELSGNGISSSWLQLGEAIRMAQELALHRNISLDLVPLAQRNRRARVWGACICADRWISLRLGQACMIDLDMCDTPGPQAYPDHVKDFSSGRWSPSFRFLGELTQMSVLLGRVYKLTSSPYGLFKADDSSLLIAQTEIDMWVAQLPKAWPYSPTLQTYDAAELINVFCVALEFTLIRPFQWPVGAIPHHIIYRPAPQRWSVLVSRARQATAWAETASGMFCLDVWSNVTYPISTFAVHQFPLAPSLMTVVVCAFFVHIRMYEQSQTEEARSFIERTDDVIQGWAAILPDSPSRGKIAAMTKLLRETAGPTTSSPTNSLSIITPGGSLVDNWLETVTNGVPPMQNVGMPNSRNDNGVMSHENNTLDHLDLDLGAHLNAFGGDCSFDFVL